MADIRLDFNSENLDKLIAQLKETLALYDKINKKVEKGEISYEQAALASKKIHAEQLKIQNSITRQEMASEKLNQKQKEQLGILGKMEKEVRQFRSAMKSAQTEAEFKKAQAGLRATQKQIKKLKDDTNTWAKALGSFQFKFNALGNIAGNALNGISQKIKSTITQFTSFEKIIGSTQATSDEFDITMSKLKSTFNEINKTIAQGNWTGLRDRIREANKAAEEYQINVDGIADAQNSLSIQTERAKRTVKELQELYNDTSQDPYNRLKAALEAQEILNKLQEKQEQLAKQNVDNEFNNIKTLQGLNEEQIAIFRKYIEEQGLGIDANIDKFDDLGKALNNYKKSVQILFTEYGSDWRKLAWDNEEVNNLVKYENQVKRMGKAMGVDLWPILKAVNETTDEQRTRIKDSIVSYEAQISATQKLKNSNATMLGSIKKLTPEWKLMQEIIAKVKGGEGLEGVIEVLSGVQNAVDETSQELPKLLEPDTFEDNFEEILKDVEDFHIEMIESNDNANDLLAISNEKFRDAEKHADETLAEWKKRKKIAEAKELAQITLSETYQLLGQLRSLSMAQMDQELKDAGDNQARREEIEREYMLKDQNMAVGQALINGALGVTDVIAKNAGNPLAVAILTALTLATTAAQIATIKAQKFEKGGEVGGLRHSQGGTHIEAEKGEYVINRRSTSKYKNIIEGINEDNHMKILMAMGKDKKIVMSHADQYTEKIYKHLKSLPTSVETNDAFIIVKNGVKTILPKPGKTVNGLQLSNIV